MNNSENEGEKKGKRGVGVGYCEKKFEINTQEMINRESKQKTCEEWSGGEAYYRAEIISFK